MDPIYSIKEISNTKVKFAPMTNGNKELERIYKPNDDSYLMLYTVLRDL